MVISEAEAEARLAELRQRRESIEREIRDLTLYLELGRRLVAEETDPAHTGSHGPVAEPGVPDADAAHAGLAGEAPRRDATPAAGTVAEATQALRAALRAPSPAPPPARGPAPGAPQAAHQPALSEGAQARRYGRALIAQTLAILDQARRPLHASEILAALEARGFPVPGHDPVAALNTRLWKRAGPDGVLRRLGDALYALPETSMDDTP